MWTEAGNGMFFISSKLRLCTKNNIVHIGAVNILTQERECLCVISSQSQE